jgi:hypothetical protein
MAADKDDRLILGVVLGAVAVWLWSMRCGFLGGAAFGGGAGQASASGGAGSGQGGCAGCAMLPARPSYCPPINVSTGNYAQGAGPSLQGGHT